MTPRLVVRSAAEADIAAAALWYEERATGLGTEFLRAVDVTLAEIRRMPERFPVIHRSAAARCCAASPTPSTSSRRPT